MNDHVDSFEEDDSFDENDRFDIERTMLSVYSRIITHQGVSFNTGLNMMFSKSDPFIKEHIRRHKENYRPLGELSRFLELYNKYSSSTDRINPLITKL